MIGKITWSRMNIDKMGVSKKLFLKLEGVSGRGDSIVEPLYLRGDFEELEVETF